MIALAVTLELVCYYRFVHRCQSGKDVVSIIEHDNCILRQDLAEWDATRCWVSRWHFVGPRSQVQTFNYCDLKTYYT